MKRVLAALSGCAILAAYAQGAPGTFRVDWYSPRVVEHYRPSVHGFSTPYEGDRQPLHTVKGKGAKSYIVGTFLPEGDAKSGDPPIFSARRVDAVLWFNDGSRSWTPKPLPDHAVRMQTSVAAVTLPSGAEALCMAGGRAQAGTLVWLPTNAVMCSTDDGDSWTEQARLPFNLLGASWSQSPDGLFLVGGMAGTLYDGGLPGGAAMHRRAAQGQGQGQGQGQEEEEEEEAAEAGKEGAAARSAGTANSVNGQGRGMQVLAGLPNRNNTSGGGAASINGTTGGGEAGGWQAAGGSVQEMTWNITYAGILKANMNPTTGLIESWTIVRWSCPLGPLFYPMATWTWEGNGGQGAYIVGGGVSSEFIEPSAYLWQVAGGRWADDSAWTQLPGLPYVSNVGNGIEPEQAMVEMVRWADGKWSMHPGPPFNVTKEIEKAVAANDFRNAPGSFLMYVAAGVVYVSSSYGDAGWNRLNVVAWPAQPLEDGTPEREGPFFMRSFYVAQGDWPNGNAGVVYLAGTGLHTGAHNRQAQFTGKWVTAYPNTPCVARCAPYGGYFSRGCSQDPFDSMCVDCMNSGGCVVAEYEVRACSTRLDGRGHPMQADCKPCASCGEGYEVAVACSKRNDTVCSALAPPWTSSKSVPAAPLPEEAGTALLALGCATLVLLGLSGAVKMCSSQGLRRHVSGLCPCVPLCPRGLQLPARFDHSYVVRANLLATTALAITTAVFTGTVGADLLSTANAALCGSCTQYGLGMLLPCMVGVASHALFVFVAWRKPDAVWSSMEAAGVLNRPVSLLVALMHPRSLLLVLLNDASNRTRRAMQPQGNVGNMGAGAGADKGLPRLGSGSSSGSMGMGMCMGGPNAVSRAFVQDVGIAINWCRACLLLLDLPAFVVSVGLFGSLMPAYQLPTDQGVRRTALASLAALVLTAVSLGTSMQMLLAARLRVRLLKCISGEDGSGLGPAGLGEPEYVPGKGWRGGSAAGTGAADGAGLASLSLGAIPRVEDFTGLRPAPPSPTNTGLASPGMVGMGRASHGKSQQHQQLDQWVAANGSSDLPLSVLTLNPTHSLPMPMLASTTSHVAGTPPLTAQGLALVQPSMLTGLPQGHTIVQTSAGDALLATVYPGTAAALWHEDHAHVMGRQGQVAAVEQGQGRTLVSLAPVPVPVPVSVELGSSSGRGQEESVGDGDGDGDGDGVMRGETPAAEGSSVGFGNGRRMLPTATAGSTSRMTA